VHGEYQDLYPGMVPSDFTGYPNAAHTRHRDIQDDHFRLKRIQQINQLNTVAGLSGDLQIRVLVNQAFHPPAKYDMVIGQHDPVITFHGYP